MSNHNDYEPRRAIFHLDSDPFSFLEWDQAGADAPLAHFGHANGFNAYTYRRILGPLAPRLHMIAMDFRGYGRTAAPTDPAAMTSWERHADDLEAFLDSFGKPLILAGHSMGGIVSLKLAARRPDLVTGLLLLDPVMFPPKWSRRWGVAKRLGLGPYIPLARMARRRRTVWPDRETVKSAYRGRGAFRTWPEEMLDDYLDGGLLQRKDGSVELSCAPAWEAHNFSVTTHTAWKTLTCVRCPVTLIYGESSDAFLAESARAFARIQPDARLVPVEGATHFVPMEAPHIVRRELRLLCGLPESGGPDQTCDV